MEIRRVAVFGGGTMGHGIAHVLARYGIDVLVCDVSESALTGARSGIQKNLGREVARGKLTGPEAEQALARVAFTSNLSDTARPDWTADWVVEAIPEKIALKRALFTQLDEIMPPSAILASNTSSLSITELAASTHRPDRVLGLHFMNPAPMMQLVEVIRGLSTSDATMHAAQQLVHRIARTPVEARDFPGFVSNRVLLPMINEAIYCVMESVARPEAVDEIMKLGMNHPMGPLSLADLIGLDVCLQILETMQAGLGDDKYRPCPLLRSMVAAGWLGRKSGRGFYQY